jgi:hypothetical protein
VAEAVTAVTGVELHEPFPSISPLVVALQHGNWSLARWLLSGCRTTAVSTTCSCCAFGGGDAPCMPLLFVHHNSCLPCCFSSRVVCCCAVMAMHAVDEVNILCSPETLPCRMRCVLNARSRVNRISGMTLTWTLFMRVCCCRCRTPVQPVVAERGHVGRPMGECHLGSRHRGPSAAAAGGVSSTTWWTGGGGQVAGGEPIAGESGTALSS